MKAQARTLANALGRRLVLSGQAEHHEVPLDLPAVAPAPSRLRHLGVRFSGATQVSTVSSGSKECTPCPAVLAPQLHVTQLKELLVPSRARKSAIMVLQASNAAHLLSELNSYCEVHSARRAIWSSVLAASAPFFNFTAPARVIWAAHGQHARCAGSQHVRHSTNKGH